MTDLQRNRLEAVLRFILAICVLAVAVAVSTQAADACEVCVEDHVAATYDFQVLARARAAGRSVLYVAVRGKDATAPRNKDAIQQAISTVAGVDGSSIRFSVMPPAASFAWDPKRYRSGEILRVVNNRLAGNNLSLVALRVIDPTL